MAPKVPLMLSTAGQKRIWSFKRSYVNMRLRAGSPQYLLHLCPSLVAWTGSTQSATDWLLTASEKWFSSNNVLKTNRWKCVCSNQWCCFGELLSVAYSKPFTRKITCTEKAPARRNELNVVIHTCTVTYAHSHREKNTCQTNKKLFC